MGCGLTAPKAQLRRFVVRDGRLTDDPAGRAPGRGAYLHPGSDACWQRAARRRAFARALRAPVDPGPAAPSPAPRMDS